MCYVLYIYIYTRTHTCQGPRGARDSEGYTGVCVCARSTVSFVLLCVVLCLCLFMFVCVCFLSDERAAHPSPDRVRGMRQRVRTCQQEQCYEGGRVPLTEMLSDRIARQGAICLISRNLSSMKVSNRIIPPSELWPCTPAAETAVHPSIWCSERSSSQSCSTPEECYFS